MTDDQTEHQNTSPLDPAPALRVQRMGRLFRIVYDTSRNLALFNSGDPVDKGGFENEMDARIEMSKALSGNSVDDAEAEGIG